ncbi:MAG: PLP-dependent transferase [Chitinophagaceae bacterium]|nr:PLP-dependent transferase [Chitinophagaceae bacterium]
MNATQLIYSMPVDELTGAICVPIYQTSTFLQEARANNPIRAAFEKIIAALEGGGTRGVLSAAAERFDAIIRLLKSGDEIVAIDDTTVHTGSSLTTFKNLVSMYPMLIPPIRKLYNKNKSQK